MFEFGAAASSGDGEKEPMTTMGFLDHLEELRRRIVYSIAAVAVGFFVCWWKVERIYDVMQRPIMDALKANGLAEKLVYLNPTEPFNLYLKIAALAGLFLTPPFVLYQVWMFISPGLYRNEKRYVVPFMISTITLFSAGAFSEHHSRHGTDFRNADPRVFPGVDGHHQRGIHVEEFPLFDPGNFHHRGYRHAHNRHPKYVHFCCAHDRALRGQHWRSVAGASQAASGAERETGAIRGATRRAQEE